LYCAPAQSGNLETAVGENTRKPDRMPRNRATLKKLGEEMRERLRGTVEEPLPDEMAALLKQIEEHDKNSK
jgi:hypothetical protein